VEPPYGQVHVSHGTVIDAWFPLMDSGCGVAPTAGQ